MSPAIPVLLYHSISDDPTPALAPYTLSTGLFAEHAAVIAEQRWRTLTVEGLATAIQDGNVDERPTLAITFDDGFADTADEAAPILARLKLPATLYVTSGTVGRVCTWLGREGRRPMASWQQLRDLASSGWEIGAHSVDHPELDVLRRSDRQAQILGSRAALRDHLDLPIDSFAYPHGYHGQAVRADVVAAGFRNACAVKNRMSTSSDDPFARARLTITANTTGEDLVRLLNHARGHEPTSATSGDERRATAWRCYRRVRHHTTDRVRARR